MLDYLATGDCRMEYLRRQLDDPDAQPCGRCDNCTGKPWPATVSDTTARAAGERLLRPGAEVAPRQMWPTGMRELGVDVAGRIPAGARAEPGRAVARLTDLGWGSRLRELLGQQAPDEPVPDDLTAAVVSILAAWDWAERPSAVVTLPSRTRPELIGSLGRQIAAIGRLAYAGSLEYAPGHDGGPGQDNSAQRLRAIWGSMIVPEPVRDAVAASGGPVLLVDDLIDTGWTMTVAARLLREAGAPAVLPLVLAVAG
jgi:ATP-dependent DNA helicase RecQ